MGSIVAITNKKGGICKTTVTANLSILLAKDGKKILMIDLDDTGNLTALFLQTYQHESLDILSDKNFNPRKAIYPAISNQKVILNLDIVPSSYKMGLLIRSHSPLPHNLLSNQLKKIRDEYDYIFIDCPPGFTDPSTLSIYAADFLLIPTTYEADAINGINVLFKMVKGLKMEGKYNFRIICNKFHPSKTIMHDYLNTSLADFIKRDLVFKTRIEEDQAAVNAKAAVCPLVFYAPQSRAAKNYQAFAQEFKELMQ